MHILMISDDFYPAETGVGAHLLSLAPELVKRGHQVSVLTSRRKGMKSREQYCGVNIYRLPTLKIFGFYQALSTKRMIRKLLEEIRPDLIHHHYLSQLLINVCHVAKRMKISQVFTYHMSPSLLTEPFLLRPFKHIVQKLFVKYVNKFDLLLCPSRGVAHELKQQGIQRSIKYLSNPIPSIHVPDESQQYKNKFIVFYAGRLAVEKNLPLLLKGFQMATERHPDIILKIAGRGPMEEELHRMARKMGLVHNCEFLGFLNREELTQHYVDANVLVLPSVKEVQGMVVLEAMQCGKPVIMTDKLACAKELVIEGKNGFIISHTDYRSLSKKIEKLYQSSELCQNMGQYSKELSKSFELENIVTLLDKNYSELRL